MKEKGVFLLNAEGLDEDEFTMEMIDGGAEDVEFNSEHVNVLSEMEDFGNIQRNSMN